MVIYAVQPCTYAHQTELTTLASDVPELLLG